MGRPNLPPWQQVFSEMAEAGFLYAELGPLGYLPQDASVIRNAMSERKLQVVGAALLEPLLDPAVTERSLNAARRLSRLISESGGKFLVIVDWVTPERGRTAGRPSDAPRLTGERLSHFHWMFEEIGRISKKEFGVQAVAHAHGGTYLEFEDEIEALLAATDPDLVELAIDTGHSVFAGFDPTALYEHHCERTTYVNFKDVDGVVLERANREKLSFLEAVDAGIFCKLGAGVVDLRAFTGTMMGHSFSGPAVIEQDRDPASPGDPLSDARQSIAFLKSIGLEAGMQKAV